MSDKLKAAVMGDGAWGTALAMVLRENGHDTTLWGAFPEYVEEMKASRMNSTYLPDVTLPDELTLSSDIDEALAGADLIVLATPSKFYRQTLERFAGKVSDETLIVSVAKGLDPDTGQRMTEVAKEVLSVSCVAALSGPSHAEEVSRRIPSAVAVGCTDGERAARIANAFVTDRMRVYTSDDVIGVEYGGCLKNIIAVAVGVSDGIGFGDNTRAALITRGLAEMARVGCTMGGKRETFSGLSGVGDLIVTCTSKLSRNRGFGERLGRGETADQIMADTKMAVEGVWNCRAARRLAQEHSVEVPITDEVYAVVHEGKDPHEAVIDLLGRPARHEAEGC